MESKKKIILPNGSFKGNCTDCVYANWHDKDSYGRVHCDGPYGGYNHPKDRNGCFYFKD